MREFEPVELNRDNNVCLSFRNRQARRDIYVLKHKQKWRTIAQNFELRKKVSDSRELWARDSPSNHVGPDCVEN